MESEQHKVKDITEPKTGRRRLCPVVRGIVSERGGEKELA
jgi:hypothetical protein